jgi:5-methylcytosine-specific restriction protein A
VIENAVALCPNCHKACHHSSEAAELANKLYDRVSRLKR